MICDKEILDLLDHYTKHGWTIFKTAEKYPWIIDGHFGSVEAPTIREAVMKAITKQAEWATALNAKHSDHPIDDGRIYDGWTL